MTKDIQGPPREDLNQFVLDTEAAIAMTDYTELYELISNQMKQSDPINNKFISKEATKACQHGAFVLSYNSRLHTDKDKKIHEAKEIDKLLAAMQLHIKHYGIKDYIELKGRPLKKYKEMRQEQKIQSMGEPWATAAKVSLAAPKIFIKGALISIFMTTQTDGQKLKPAEPTQQIASKIQHKQHTSTLERHHL